MEINIYTMPTCGICKVMKTKMKAKNIPFNEYNLEEHLDLFDITTAPILTVDDKIYCSPTEINEWINNY